MIRFTRRVILKNSSYVPQAIGFTTELNGYLNKKHGIQLEAGLEVFGQNAMTWFLEVPSMARLEEINRNLIADGDYWKMLQKNKEMWLDGSLVDTVVDLIPTTRR